MEHAVTLPDGPKLDGQAQTDAVLCELTGVAYAECLEQAEKLVQVPVGADDKGNVIFEHKLVASPNKMAMLVLRKRIKRIGEISGPLPDNVWNKLTPRDINVLLEESDKFDEVLSGVQPLGEPPSGSHEI